MPVSLHNIHCTTDRRSTIRLLGWGALRWGVRKQSHPSTLVSLFPPVFLHPQFPIKEQERDQFLDREIG